MNIKPSLHMLPFILVDPWYKTLITDNSGAIAVTVTILLIALFAAFIFTVDAEKIARKVYELTKIGLTDPSGRSVVVAVFGVIAAGVGFGLYNSQIFEKLTDSSYARGVITYLITIATIGLVFVLVLQIMFVKSGSEEQIKGAREILTVLTGILGTIVGFYFGQASDQTKALRIAHLAIAPIINGQERVTAFVEGGIPPYNYIVFSPDENNPVAKKEGQSSTGIVVEDITTQEPADVEISIIDARNNTDKRKESAPDADTGADDAATPPDASTNPTKKAPAGTD